MVGCYTKGRVKNLGNGWSIVSENKVVLNFDFRQEPKIRSFGPPVAKLWPNIFQQILIYFTQSLVTLDEHKLNQNKNIFINDMHWDIPGLWTEFDWTPEPPKKKNFFPKMWFFGDLGFPSVILVN